MSNNVLGDLPRDGEESDENRRYIGDMKFRYENEKLVKRVEVNPPDIAAGAEVREELLDTVVIEVEPKEDSNLENISKSSEKPRAQTAFDDSPDWNKENTQDFEARINLEEGHGVVVTTEVATENDVLGFITDTLTRYGHNDGGFSGDVEYLAEKQFAKMIDDFDPGEMKSMVNNDV